MYSGTNIPQPDNMTPEQLAAIAAQSEKEFTTEMAEPPKPAIGTEAPAGNTTPPPAGGSMFDYVEPAKEPQPAQEPKPDYDDYRPFTDDGPAGSDPKEVLAGMTMDEMLDIRFAFEAMMISEFIDSHSAPDTYMPDEFEKKLYAAVYKPYKSVAAEKLPPWLWVLMVEVVFTGRRFMRAIKARKVNKRNEAAAKVESNTTGQMAGIVNKLVPLVNKKNEPTGPLPGKRTNWKIFEDGSYHYCRETANQKAGYRKQGTQPVEKVDLTNLEDVKRVIKSSGWPKLQRAFDLPANWLEAKGIDVNNLGLEEE